MNLTKKSFYIILLNFLFSEFISESIAVNTAENFFYSKNQREVLEFSYDEVILINKNNEDIFYVIQLNPRGFILVAADNSDIASYEEYKPSPSIL